LSVVGGAEFEQDCVAAISRAVIRPSWTRWLSRKTM
jgi:hypothetical protein